MLLTDAANLKESQIPLDEMAKLEMQGALLESQERYAEEVSEFEDGYHVHLSDEEPESW